jgi:hypothetical protein
MEKKFISIMLSDLKQEKQRYILERLPQDAADKANLGTIPLFMLEIKETGEVKTKEDGTLVADNYINEYFTQDIRMSNFFLIFIPYEEDYKHLAGYWSQEYKMITTTRTMITWYTSYDKAVEIAETLGYKYEIRGHDKMLF